MVAKYLFFSLLIFGSNVLAHPKIEARIAQITQALKQTPNNSHLYLQRAELYREHREFGMAEKDYQQAIAKGEDKNSVAYFQAMLLRDQGKLIAAQKLFNQVVNNVKDESLQLLALVNLAEMLKLDKKWLLAAQNYEKALKLDKKQAVSLITSCADAYNHAGIAYYNKAVTILKQGLDYHKGVIGLYDLGIEMAQQRGKKQDEIWWIKQLAKMYPNYSKYKKRLQQLKQ